MIAAGIVLVGVGVALSVAGRIALDRADRAP